MANVPATERQKAYATALGIRFSPDISKDDISDLISAAVSKQDEDQQTEEARVWVLSVLRHITKADWFLFDDAPVVRHEIDEIAAKIAADEKLMDYIGEQTASTSDAYDNMADDRDAEGDDWYFFNTGGGPSSRSKAYTITASMLQSVTTVGSTEIKGEMFYQPANPSANSRSQPKPLAHSGCLLALVAWLVTKP